MAKNCIPANRIYPDAPTVPFMVRVHEKQGAGVKRLAQRLGVSEIEAKRQIVEAGLEALQVA